MDSAFDLTAAVRARSWAWLFKIASSLNAEVRIVDLRTAPLLSAPSDSSSATLHDPEFVAAVGRAQRAQSVETVQIGRTMVACVVLRVAGSDAAVLVLSRRIASKQSTPSDQWRLDQVAGVLRPAVEAHLETEVAESEGETERLTALRRALDDADARSELDVMRIFGDALSIWEDVDVRAYTLGVDGSYLQQWAPAGASDDQIPTVLSVPPALQSRELSRLAVENLDQLGIVSNDEIVAAEIAPDGSRWMLMFTRAVDPARLKRLSLYVDVLEQSLKQLSLGADLQLSRRLWDRLLGGDDQPSRAGEAALAEIVQAVGGAFGALLVTLPRGGRALAAGATERFTDLQSSGSPHQLTVSRRLASGGSLTVAIGRTAASTPFSLRDRSVLDGVADLLEPWAAAIMRQPALATERRTVARPFQQIVEEVAQQTVRSGGSVSVLVIRLAGGEARPGAAHRLAAQIRSHLRAAEPAGAVTEGEIAAVLFDTNPDQARAVVSRLRGLGPSFDDGDALASAAVGVAHCAAGSVYDTPLLLAAREDALRSANDVSSGGRIQ